MALDLVERCVVWGLFWAVAVCVNACWWLHVGVPGPFCRSLCRSFLLGCTPFGEWDGLVVALDLGSCWLALGLRSGEVVLVTVVK